MLLNYKAIVYVLVIPMVFYSMDSLNINMIFKKNKKQTLFSYTVNKRIEKSKELLKDDTLSVSKISRMVGYSSNAYFATAFKKTVGVTPMQYRNRILGIN